jgi:predicted GNAT family acetyltransferase
MAEDVQVRDNPDESRYEVSVDGRLAGFSEYALHGEDADFLHTEIDDAFSGRGLATHLIRAALDDARARGWRVMPYCRFVRKFIAEHADYVDLVPADQRARFGLAS